MGCSKKTWTLHSCDTSAKDAWSQSNQEEIAYKPKVRDIIQNNWPVIFKSIKVMEVNSEELWQVE